MQCACWNQRATLTSPPRVTVELKGKERKRTLLSVPFMKPDYFLSSFFSMF